MKHYTLPTHQDDLDKLLDSYESIPLQKREQIVWDIVGSPFFKLYFPYAYTTKGERLRGEHSQKELETLFYDSGFIATVKHYFDLELGK